MKTISAMTESADFPDPRLYEDWNQASTVFDLFEGDYSIKLITIKLQCPVCGHTWGVKLDDYDEYHQIPDRKFSCQNCRHQR
jgi:hypothetical protein